MSDTVVVDGVCELDIPIEGECGTFYKVNPTSEALTVQPTSEDVTYQPTADYFSEVTVEGIKGERTITENGDYDVLTDKQVTVSVDPPTLEPLTAMANGRYTPQGDGFNVVTVNVPDPPLEALTADANGTYTPTTYGFSEVTVDVPPDTEPLNVTANGEYTREGGYNPVTVEIPEYEGAYTVTPTTEVQTLPTAGKVMSRDVSVGAVEPVLWKTVTLDVNHQNPDIGNPVYWFGFLEIPYQDIVDGWIYFVEFSENGDTSQYRVAIGWYDNRNVNTATPPISCIFVRGTGTMIYYRTNYNLYATAGTVINVYRFKR